jgi:hypothetical protein
MKYILAAMCVLVVLFMGGCAVLAFGAGPSALLPAGIAFLNIAILGALFGWQIKWKPAFYILGVADLILAAICGYFSAVMGSYGGNLEVVLLAAVAGVFAVKGILSFVYARQQQT